MIYRIANDKLSIAVSSLGAELVSAKQGGTERLWQNETGEWAHSAPVLFPVCGNCVLHSINDVLIKTLIMSL